MTGTWAAGFTKTWRSVDLGYQPGSEALKASLGRVGRGPFRARARQSGFDHSTLLVENDGVGVMGVGRQV